MKKYFTLTLLFFILISINITFSQVTDKKNVETSYFRPSVTFLFLRPENNNEKLLVDKLYDLPINPKFDEHKINFQHLDKKSLMQYPEPPAAVDPLNVIEYRVYKKKLNEYNKNYAFVDSVRKVQISTYVKSSTNPIIGKWMNRNSQGLMNFDLISKRGLYSSTDADASSAKNSAVDRRAEIGEKLVSKSYVFLWSVNTIKTMEDVYNEKDASGKGQKDYKPVQRTDEGFVISYTVKVYKVIFNDSVSSVFLSKLLGRYEY
jgi:hypothetical protein